MDVSKLIELLREARGANVVAAFDPDRTVSSRKYYESVYQRMDAAISKLEKETP